MYPTASDSIRQQSRQQQTHVLYGVDSSDSSERNIYMRAHVHK